MQAALGPSTRIALRSLATGLGPEYPHRFVGIVYLVALILGLGTISLQFLLSHVGTDLGHDVDLAGVGHDLGGAGGSSHDHPGSIATSPAGLFLSSRFWTFGLMAFGMVGAALHYLELCPGAIAAVLSTSSGFVSGFVAALAFRKLTQGVSSSETATDAVGQVGRVLVPVSKGHAGKIRVQIKGKTIDMLATGEAELQEGDNVLIVEVDGTNARVEPVERRQGE